MTVIKKTELKLLNQSNSGPGGGIRARGCQNEGGLEGALEADLEDGLRDISGSLFRLGSLGGSGNVGAKSSSKSSPSNERVG